MTNLSKERQAALLKILNYNQDGGDFKTAKKMFKEEFDQVNVTEITAAERELIKQGLDPRKIQDLCNVHVDLFKGDIKQDDENPEFATPGHPVKTFKQENVVIKSLVNDFLLPNLNKYLEQKDQETLGKINQALTDLQTIDRHYRRKETSLFPIMTKNGITAPPEVMWGVDDKIRNLIKTCLSDLKQVSVDQDKLSDDIHETSHEVLEMIVKEEEIMLPMIAKVASAQDWLNVKNEEGQIGYTLIAKPMNWKPEMPKTSSDSPVEISDLSSLFINFKEGSLNLKQLKAIMDLLPFAITFVDEKDRVAFFGGGANIFPHSKNSLGNSVYSCHSVESQPVIKKIFDEFHSGKKDKITYWFKPKMLGKMLYLTYYAVHDENGNYLGCLEVAQDITELQKITGEKKSE